MRKRVSIAGVGFDAVTFRGAVQRIAKLLRQKKQSYIVTPNPEMVIAARRDAAFREILHSATLAVPDGIGIIWASYFLSLKKRTYKTLSISLLDVLFRQPAVFSVLPARVTGTDLLPEIIRLATQQKLSVFLLGAAPGVAAAAAEKFKLKNATCKITTFAGSPRREDEKAIIQNINQSGAVVLAVAYGAPAQERWIVRNLPKMPRVRLAIGVGGAFDFHAGLIPRAPTLLRNLGLEWVWRLLLQPSRIGRIYTATVRFVRLVFSQNFF